MNEKFFDLKKEKQDRMINAALKVFALNGYRHASTDDIVREAAISKGLLFHYFENKLGVYAFVYDYSVRYLLLELSTAVDAKETDLFTLMQQVETGKMHAMCGYPYLQPFLNRAQAENVNEALVAVEEPLAKTLMPHVPLPCLEALVAVEERKQQMEEAYENIYARADLGKYAAAEDVVKLRKMMELTIKGLMNERILEDAFQPEMLYEEILEYLQLSRRLAERSGQPSDEEITEK